MTRKGWATGWPTVWYAKLGGCLGLAGCSGRVPQSLSILPYTPDRWSPEFPPEGNNIGYTKQGATAIIQKAEAEAIQHKGLQRGGED